jgi:hypothetical protein
MSFMVYVQKVSFGVDDNFLMTRLSHREYIVNLHVGNQMEGALSIQEYIGLYFDEGTMKISSHITMAHIWDMALQTIFFTILRLSGYAAPHLDN